jgi:CSLREA domain-containing protein
MRHFHARSGIHLGLPALLLSSSLSAATLDLKVTTFADEDDGSCTRSHCSLREAVSAANAAPDAARIILAAGEYRLQRPNLRDEEGEIIDEDDNRTGDLDVTGNLAISGAGIGQTILQGDRLDRLIEVAAGARLVLRNLTLAGGRTPHRGAGLENHGYAELLRVRVAGNVAASLFLRGEGGGLANEGELRVLSSAVEGNRAQGSESALGSGGGIYNRGTLWVRDSRIADNHCSDDNDTGRGCGIYNAGVADVARSLLESNSVSVYGSGAAILNLGELLLANSTLSGNSSGEQGGAALDNGVPFDPGAGTPVARLVHVTIAANQGYGLVNRGELSLRNSIIAGNNKYDLEEPGNCQNIGAGARYSARGLLLGQDGGNCSAEQMIVDATTFSRHLFPLEDNNQTRIHALRRPSAAIDAGVGSCASHDQRGLNRPRDGNGDGVANCDLGAFERAYP